MRKPDLTIGPANNPQTLRWHLFRWRGWQLSLHKWLRSDDDRALHDHTSWNVSLILTRGYWEIVREYCLTYSLSRGVFGWHKDTNGFWYRDRRVWRRPFIPYFRRGDIPHRIELDGAPVWTLWLRGPPSREWGFHCAKGWRHWKDYTNTRDYSAPGSVTEIGRGCD
jgi:hypothetical protein